MYIIGFRRASESSTVASRGMDRGVMGDVVQGLAVFGIAGDAIAQQCFGKCIGVFRYGSKNLIHTRAAPGRLRPFPLLLLCCTHFPPTYYIPRCAVLLLVRTTSPSFAQLHAFVVGASSRRRIGFLALKIAFGLFHTDTTTVLY